MYTEVRGGWVLRTTLTASNGVGCSTTCGASPGFVYGDNLGYSVAVSGRTLVVGAADASYPTAKNDGVGSGTAYVFTGSGASWTQNTEIADQPEYSANNDSPANCTFFTSPCNAEDEFGSAVGVLGTTVLSTAPEDSQGYPNSANGAAFVIPKKGSTWPSSNPLTKLTAADGAAGDSLGNCPGHHRARHRGGRRLPGGRFQRGHLLFLPGLTAKNPSEGQARPVTMRGWRFG